MHLAYIRRDNEVVGNLAKDFELAPDFKSLTIFLREGARWSDGHPFTADDIVFAFEAFHFDTRGDFLLIKQKYWLSSWQLIQTHLLGHACQRLY